MTQEATTREGTVCPGDVHQAIVQALAWHALEEARRLDVGALGGEVTIYGEVSSAHERQIVQEAARQFPGVTKVQNLVTVRGASDPVTGRTTADPSTPAGRPTAAPPATAGPNARR